ESNQIYLTPQQDPIIETIISDSASDTLIPTLPGNPSDHGPGKPFFIHRIGRAFSGDNDNTALLDIDITGPSLPMMSGLSPDVHPLHSTSSGWSPLYVSGNLGVMGSCCPDSAVIWRGPKKNGMIKQFLKDVDWCSTDEEGEELSQTEENEESKGEKEKEERIEYMIIDTPPGTTDEHLSIVSYLKETSITGAIIVTTPQEVSIQDSKICRASFVRIVTCNGTPEIFLPTIGGADRLRKEEGLELLGKIPLDPRIGKGSGLGTDWLNAYPDSLATKAYHDIVDKVKLKIPQSDSSSS
ncbi:hypothetical protein PSHT_06360, partial [Puccinia striiformis]